MNAMFGSTAPCNSASMNVIPTDLNEGSVTLIETLAVLLLATFVPIKAKVPNYVTRQLTVVASQIRVSTGTSPESSTAMLT